MDPLAQLLLVGVVLLVVTLVVVLWQLSSFRHEMEFRVERRVAETKEELSTLKREMDFRVEQTVAETTDQIREEALRRSRATLKGRVAELMVSFLEAFRYNPSDARFIGSPIDYVIFDGYTDLVDGAADRPLTVVLADVKVGPRARLTPAQEHIRVAVEAGRVAWETIHLGGGEAKGQ